MIPSDRSRFARTRRLAAALLLAATAFPAAAQQAPDQAPRPAPKAQSAAQATGDVGPAARTDGTRKPAARPRRVEEIPPFRAADFQKRLTRAAAAFRAGDREKALQGIDALLSRWPEIYDLHQTRAVLLALSGEPREALAALRRAAELGLRAPDATEANPAFASLKGDPEFAAVLAEMRTPAPPEATRPIPAPERPLVRNRKAPASEANASFDMATGVLRFHFRFPERRPSVPVSIVEGHEAKKFDPGGKVAKLLNEWYAQGRAAGHHGDLYDNLDRGHSDLPSGQFPQLAWVRYAKDAKARGYDYSPKKPVDFGAPTLGNSSTARTSGALWRSMPRLALTMPGGVEELWREYTSNQIYVYPEHRDHDGDKGDLFLANTPYVAISQGSSGSDKPLLNALAVAMAALPPDTKRFAVERGLLAPTLQMLLRWSQNHVSSLSTYLSGYAHPTVFEGKDINAVKIAHRAQHLTPDVLPPLVRLRVEKERTPPQGVEIFGEGLDERYFDTPSAIARIARGAARDRRMVVSAADTRDPNGRDLTFKWVLLRGDPDKVRITPLDEAGTRAEIVVSWHDEVKVPGKPKLKSRRVDIGVFADNGALHSAPAFVSIAFPATQIREYDAEGRILSVSYDPKKLEKRYADPVLFPRRGWRDVYEYDEKGRPLGWTRIGRKGAETRFTRHGARVIETDELGRPVRAETVAYPRGKAPKSTRRAQILVRPTGDILEYRYEGPEDRYGYAVPVAGTAPGN